MNARFLARLNLRRSTSLLSWLATLAFVFVLAQSLNAQDQEPGEPAGEDHYVYLPAIYNAPPVVTLNNIAGPNSANQWTVSWTATGVGITNYELQESQSPSFSSVTTYDNGPATSKVITKGPSENNIYYYRVRAEGSFGSGPWSAVKSVIGAYRTDFTGSIGSWAIRRTTFLEETDVWHEDNKLIIRVEDSWDWALASPLKPAPRVPYAIEYSAQIANFGNLVSFGGVFGGDWTGEPCPDYSTLPGVYQHDNCFNHFYNTNTIFYGPLKLAFERVDHLFWCPDCGGSPMKRLSDDYSVWKVVNVINNANPNNYNVWRIEVRPNDIRLLVNGSHYATIADDAWIHEPYFGVFASTDEYSNSTQRFDWYQVLPLD
jgi:hypothetical protein